MIILKFFRKLFLHLGTYLFVTLLVAYILLRGFSHSLLNPSFYQNEIIPALMPSLAEKVSEIFLEDAAEITPYLQGEDLEEIIEKTFPPEWLSAELELKFSEIGLILAGVKNTLSIQAFKEKIPEFEQNLVNHVIDNVSVCGESDIQAITEALSDKISRQPIEEIIPLCRPSYVSEEKFRQEFASEFSLGLADELPNEFDFSDVQELQDIREQLDKLPTPSEITGFLLPTIIILFALTSLLLFKPEQILHWQGKTLFSSSFTIVLTALPIYFTIPILETILGEEFQADWPPEIIVLIEETVPKMALPILNPGIAIGLVGIVFYFSGRWLKKQNPKKK